MKDAEPDEDQNKVANSFGDIQRRLSHIKEESIAKNNYNFADLIGTDDITLIDQ